LPSNLPSAFPALERANLSSKETSLKTRYSRRIARSIRRKLSSLTVQYMKEETTMFRKTLSVLMLTAALGGFATQAFARSGGGTGDVVIIGAQPDNETTAAGNGGTSKGGEVPVTPGAAGNSGTSKGGEVPVTPGLAG
jgi:hypothetical protein